MTDDANDAATVSRALNDLDTAFAPLEDCIWTVQHFISGIEDLCPKPDPDRTEELIVMARYSADRLTQHLVELRAGRDLVDRLYRDEMAPRPAPSN